MQAGATVDRNCSHEEAHAVIAASAFGGLAALLGAWDAAGGSRESEVAQLGCWIALVLVVLVVIAANTQKTEAPSTTAPTSSPVPQPACKEAGGGGMEQRVLHGRWQGDESRVRVLQERGTGRSRWSGQWGDERSFDGLGAGVFVFREAAVKRDEHGEEWCLGWARFFFSSLIVMAKPSRYFGRARDGYRIWCLLL